MSNYEHGGVADKGKVKIDFSVNVNPLGVAPSIMNAMKEALPGTVSYPDPESRELKSALAGRLLTDRNRLVLGNGASELLMAFMYAYKPKRILTAAPGFYGYEHAAEAVGSSMEFYRLKEEAGFEADAGIIDMIRPDTDLIILTNPNNPTGRLIPEDVLEAVYLKAAQFGARLLIDECFLDFTERESFDRPGVYRLNAFTKYYAIPGVRLGYLICPSKAEAGRIENCLPEWNVSVPAQAAGLAAVNEENHYRNTRTCIKEGRTFLTKELRGLNMKAYPSDANFILFYTEQQDLKEKMLEKGILIRDCRNFRNLGKGYYRVAVKSPEQNMILVNALKEVLIKC